VSANVELLGKNFAAAKSLVREALALYRTTPDLVQFQEAVQLASELEQLDGKLP